MKVIIEADIPFAWAHGGLTTLVREIHNGLKQCGLEVDYCRWWDENQWADVYLGFGPLTPRHQFAKQRGMAIVNYVFLDSFSRRNAADLWLRALVIATALKFGRNVVAGLGWNYAEIADASIYPSQADACLARDLFGAPLSRGHVILHGVPPSFLAAGLTAPHDGEYLLTASTIHPRKNSLLLARLAIASKTPVVFVGKPYDESASYFREFLGLVDGKYVGYEGFVTEERKIELLSHARGFVLLSQQESGCIAVLEAFATGCQVLLSDLRWANPLYAGHASFCSPRSLAQAARQLRSFYDQPVVLPLFPVQSWDSVAREYAQVLRSVVEKR